MWIERSWFVRNSEPCNAGITQSAECQICNLNVVGATPTTGFRVQMIFRDGVTVAQNTLDVLVEVQILVPEFYTGSITVVPQTVNLLCVGSNPTLCAWNLGRAV